jgi:hypothetical protein
MRINQLLFMNGSLLIYDIIPVRSDDARIESPFLRLALHRLKLKVLHCPA